MNIRRKLTVLFGVIAAIYLITILANIVFDRQRENFYFKHAKISKERSFNMVMELVGSPLELCVYDYTFWDEMVDFAEGKTPKDWPKFNLDTTFDTYSTNAVWAYDKDKNQLYAYNNIENASTKEISIPHKELIGKFLSGGNHLCHFFINTSEGLMEVRGGTIHPSKDEERATPVRGYFLVGRLWDDKYAELLTQYMEAKIDIIPGGEGTRKRDGSVFTRNIEGWEGGTIAVVVVHVENPTTTNLKNAHKAMLLADLVLMGAVLGLILFVVIGWINAPLASISEALKKEDPAMLGDLVKDKSEFGEIAQLIKRFFEQRQALFREIDMRSKAEEKLKEKLDEVKRFNEVLVGREARIIELKKEVNNLAGELGKPGPYSGS